MLKNKFNIGQKVIVVCEGNVVEKRVESISVKGEQLMYELNENPASSFPLLPHLVDSVHSLDLHKPWPIRFEAPSPNFRYVKRYAESEIFESEDDFRANIVIKKIEPSKKELKQQLREYNVADETLKDLIDKAV